MSAKAVATRLNILNKAFELIYRQGFRSTSIDEIIATTQVTKGAFFYHFKNKDEMGIAMINEVLSPGMKGAITETLKDVNDPKEAIYRMMKSILMEDPFFDVRYGCPAINLIEELSSYNDTFKEVLYRLSLQWKDAIAKCIESGKTTGKISETVNPDEAALFILSGYGGIRNLGKLYGKQCYTAYLKEVKNYLDQL